MSRETDMEGLTGPELESLIEKIARAEEDLEKHVGPEVDAVLDPVRSAPVFLRHANKALRQSEARYRRLLESLSAIVLEMKPDGTIEWANEAACIRTGLERERLIGSNWKELFVPVDHPEALEKIHRVWTGGDISHREETLRINGSGELVLDLNSANRYSDEGALERIILLGTDITARRRAQAEREKAYAKLETVLASMAEAVVVYDQQGGILQLNHAACAMLDYSEDECRAIPAGGLTRTRIENDRALRQIPVSVALRGETVRSRLLTFERTDRPSVHVSASVVPIQSSEGEILGAVASMADVTELHDLQQQQNLYAHTISHDLRTPLSAIRGYAELLRLTLTTEDQTVKKSIKGILESSERMSDLIQDLVEMSRLEGGELRLEKEWLQLQPFLNNLLERLKAAFDTERIELHVPRDLPPVSGDISRLERVMINLLTNALKYSPADTPVRIDLFSREETVEIAVTDRGQGIAGQDQSRVFDKFFSPSSNQQPDSVGIGLYITRLLVNAHGGEIEVESTPGEGSTFRFTLPVADSPPVSEK